jgi:hypothetical protein
MQAFEPRKAAKEIVETVIKRRAKEYNLYVQVANILRSAAF